jgi:NitT/TauT family transport system substrate-binding protein
MFRAFLIALTIASAVAAHAQDAKTYTVTVGLIPIVDVSPIFVGIKKGIFKRHGLDLKPSFAGGGAAIVPGVVSGSVDIGYSNTVSLLTAVQKGLPLQLIAPGSQVGATQALDHCFIYARGSSDIKSVADLAGKIIAVNTVKNLGDISTRATLEAAGIDSSSVKFVEVPFPDMEAALQNGRVDATWPCEPFNTTAADAGQRRIVGTLVGTLPNLQFSAYFVNQAYAKANPEVVTRFQRAMAESLRYAQANPEELRLATTEYAKVSPSVAKRMILPVWTALDIDRPSLKRLSEMSVKYGVIPRAPDLDRMVNDGT